MIGARLLSYLEPVFLYGSNTMLSGRGIFICAAIFSSSGRFCPGSNVRPQSFAQQVRKTGC